MHTWCEVRNVASQNFCLTPLFALRRPPEYSKTTSFRKKSIWAVSGGKCGGPKTWVGKLNSRSHFETQRNPQWR